MGAKCQALTGDIPNTKRCPHDAKGVRDYAEQPHLACGIHLKTQTPNWAVEAIDPWALQPAWNEQIAEIYSRSASRALNRASEMAADAAYLDALAARHLAIAESYRKYDHWRAGESDRLRESEGRR